MPLPRERSRAETIREEERRAEGEGEQRTREGVLVRTRVLGVLERDGGGG